MIVRRNCDVARRHVHVDQEVRAREREEDVDALLVEQDRVEREPAVRRRGAPARRTASRRGRSRSCRRRTRPCCGRRPSRAPAPGSSARARAAGLVGERPDDAARRRGSRSANGRRQPKSREDLRANVARGRARPGSSCGRSAGRPGCTRSRSAARDEDRGRRGRRCAEHARRHRVEERLRELGPLVVDEQADVAELRLAARRASSSRSRLELGAQPLDVLARRARRRSGSAP